jgi:hypothetical protein
MEIVDQKIEELFGLICKTIPKMRDECEVENRSDGSRMIFGPFPSFIILVEEIGAPRALIHVNADAPNMSYLFHQLPDVVIDGAFAVDGSTGDLIMGPEAYKKKEENILMFAKDILERRGGKQDILVPNSRIIIAS